MTPYYQDDWLTILEGDCRTVMAEMEPESVQCVVTSPPYLGLRDYGIAPSVWGGEAHEHEWGAIGRPHHPGQVEQTKWKNATAAGAGGTAGSGQFCPCGAWLGVLGLEPTVELYVAHMVEVFRGVRRVLRKDGTVWLNLGDSYSNDTKWGGSSGGKHVAALHGNTGIGRTRQHTGMKPKDRMMIPARVAIALQADGWWLRDEIVWHKPNPMPSSVTDRTTPAHEMVYLLTKSARYYYDAEAIREPHADMAGGVERFGNLGANGGNHGTPPRPDALVRTDFARRPGGREYNPAGRNKRSVWTIPTAPYPEAHFATFPPKLIEPMILAGSKPGDVILDPFGGSGTVGVVAQMHSRRAVLIDLNPDYLAQQMQRNAQSPLGLETA